MSIWQFNGGIRPRPIGAFAFDTKSVGDKQIVTVAQLSTRWQSSQLDHRLSWRRWRAKSFHHQARPGRWWHPDHAAVQKSSWSRLAGSSGDRGGYDTISSIHCNWHFFAKKHNNQNWQFSKLPHSFFRGVTLIFQRCSMFFSPFAKGNQAEVWPRFENLLKLLLWNKVIEWVKVLNALGPLRLWQCLYKLSW